MDREEWENQRLSRVADQALRTSSQASNGVQQNSNQEDYLRAARLLLGCYRTGDANDPEVYIAAVVRVLSDYPIDIVQRVVDPVTGLPSRVKWLPAVPEIIAACEELAGLRRRLDEYERRSKMQLDERAREDKIRAKNLNGAEIAAKYGPNFGLKLTPEPNKSEIHKRMADHSRDVILREYEREGVNPVYFGGQIVSPTLLKQLGQWPK